MTSSSVDLVDHLTRFERGTQHESVIVHQPVGELVVQVSDKIVDPAANALHGQLHAVETLVQGGAELLVLTLCIPHKDALLGVLRALGCLLEPLGETL